MEPTQTKNVVKRAKRATEEVEDTVENVEGALRERVEQARDIVEDLRDRAEMAFHERPYLLPVATGALGFGVGMLVGSKLSRMILFTAAGALLSDTVRTQVARISRDFVKELGAKLDEGEDEVDAGASSEAV
jgi:ElaB/YqjD/DUF883 family membrane-anchored ribosome-binding protein